MRTLRLLAALGLPLLLSGCAEIVNPGGECRILQAHVEYWVPILEQTHADTVFRSERFPLDTARSGKGLLRTVEVARDETPQTENPEAVKLPPIKIQLSFETFYLEEAYLHWKEDGWLAVPQSFRPNRLLHEVRLELPALEKGTYAFGPQDTAQGLTVRMLAMLESGDGFGIAPSALEYSGFIRIEKRFTSKSGKFSYRVNARYLDGQVSTFTGTATFEGYEHVEYCY